MLVVISLLPKVWGGQGFKRDSFVITGNKICGVLHFSLSQKEAKRKNTNSSPSEEYPDPSALSEADVVHVPNQAFRSDKERTDESEATQNPEVNYLFMLTNIIRNRTLPKKLIE